MAIERYAQIKASMLYSRWISNEHNPTGFNTVAMMKYHKPFLAVEQLDLKFIPNNKCNYLRSRTGETPQSVNTLPVWTKKPTSQCKCTKSWHCVVSILEFRWNSLELTLGRTDHSSMSMIHSDRVGLTARRNVGLKLAKNIAPSNSS